MTKFLYSENLVSPSLANGVLPWEFKPEKEIPLQIRKVKQDRQMWYQDVNTKHHFYTGLEPVNPNARINKEGNPPLYIHAFIADYDLPLSDERVNEAVAAFPHKPTWAERSLGGNVRLVWVLPFPLLVSDYGFCTFLLKKAADWLALNLLPGLDEPAFLSPTRLYCNGCDWRQVGVPMPEIPLQAFFVKAGKEFEFKGTPEENALPLDMVEAAIREKFPAFSWPTAFELESQGPTFWIPESVSPLSAIVKKGGMFTFSANATKPFYSWGELLGSEFITKFSEGAIAAATSNIFWDSNKFWRIIGGVYAPLGKDELMTHFRVSCKLSSKPDSSGSSPMETALNFIYTKNRIQGAVPFVLRPMGPLFFQGERHLNTYAGKAVPPAVGEQKWGADGNFPFISFYLQNFFSPTNPQLFKFLAWWQYYYQAALNCLPMPGQNCFILGPPGIGKTLLSRELVGTSVGGYVDASGFITEGETFNSHLFRQPHWALDDDSPSNSPQALLRVSSLLKKLVANQQFVYNEKFVKSAMLEWMGRIMISANLDHVSSRIVGPLDNGTMDKINLFKCSGDKINFPGRTELKNILEKELPYFLKWLIDWRVPDFIERDSRYGFIAYQEPTLLDQTHQSSYVAPFKEVLVDFLTKYFAQNPDALYYEGTVVKLLQAIMSDPMNDFVVRSIRLEQVSRYLDHVQREGMIRCTTSNGAQKTRVWRFFRFDSSVVAPATETPTPSSEKNPFAL
jgi:hypothetical protein